MGANLRRVDTWKPIVSSLMKMLSTCWKSRQLSIRESLTLINSEFSMMVLSLLKKWSWEWTMYKFHLPLPWGGSPCFLVVGLCAGCTVRGSFLVDGRVFLEADSGGGRCLHGNKKKLSINWKQLFFVLD
ncbi:hypothetical protein MTR_1g021310 [Medicago truncatula]|uniref:Uncharacterized protein n=1 Tax=Medicago truncatula TaxID=3880 RepID=G7I4K3_MEDTR|nr:hypothetical protein MTR_1g021310 [Medicago truncatula]